MFPFVVEEWGKGRVFVVPAGWQPLSDGSNIPKTYRRGRPGPGTFALYFGEKNVADRLKRGPIFYQGFAYNEKDANERLRAFLKRKLGSNLRHRRARLKKMGLPPDADVQTLYNAIASRAKSESHAGKPGT